MSFSKRRHLTGTRSVNCRTTKVMASDNKRSAKIRVDRTSFNIFVLASTKATGKPIAIIRNARQNSAAQFDIDES